MGSSPRRRLSARKTFWARTARSRAFPSPSRRTSRTGYSIRPSTAPGEFTANQVDANFNRLAHIHDDLIAGIKTVTTNNNANRVLIINNDKANRTLIINNDTLIKDAIISNDNLNKNAIINNDNANKDAIVNNDKANKDAIFAELRRVCGR